MNHQELEAEVYRVLAIDSNDERPEMMLVSRVQHIILHLWNERQKDKSLLEVAKQQRKSKMQELETIKDTLNKAWLYSDDLPTDMTSKLEQALTALNQLEQKLNKEIDVDAACENVGLFCHAWWNSASAADKNYVRKIVKTTIAEIERQRES